MTKIPHIYKSGNRWLMDTTTKVAYKMVPITIEPDAHHLSLWFELHPEDDVTSSVYHDMHAVKCSKCGLCLDCAKTDDSRCPRTEHGYHIIPNPRTKETA